MGPSRPNNIDLGSSVKPALSRSQAGSPSPRDIPSPRSGDIPPALSPLDAFALQGRLLAQKFEESGKNGQRISRLPPLTIANELAKPRPGYYANNPASSSPASDHEQTPTEAYQSGTSPEIARQEHRPRSMYPFITTFDDAESILTLDTDATDEQSLAPVPEDEDVVDESLPSRTISPPPTDPTSTEQQRVAIDVQDQLRSDSSGFFERTRKAPPPPLMRSDPNSLSATLLPPQPRSPMAQSSIRSVRMDSGEDSDSLSIPGDPQDRKASFSSAHSRPKSPFSPVFAPRSPSISSDYSTTVRPRGSINFSRPISRAGRQSSDVRPSFDGPSRPLGSDSPPMRPSMDTLSSQRSLDNIPPLSSSSFPQSSSRLYIDDDEYSSADQNASTPAPSYTYTKWSLPRGRNVSRTSTGVPDSYTHKFEWQQPVIGTNVTPFTHDGQAEIPIQALNLQDQEQSRNVSSASLELRPPQLDPPPRSQSADRASSTRTSRSHKPNPSFPPANSSPLSKPALTAGLADETLPRIRAIPPQLSPLVNTHSDSLTPEEHLSMGIKCHEDGALQKSTYHLRIAARAGNATAMLLYALACRHGWGMRSNQAEGVAWLRKAVDSAGLEVASDEALESNDDASSGVNNAVARRTHKAQLALSIYELGVSYMNGWGITQDKPLGLRCFEIAGGWGDGDALAEAGFCYVKGLGCKKDLFKAADLYRRAEQRGVEMAGNSWIYKEKYMPSPDSNRSGTPDDGRKGRSGDKDKDKKPRDKSRTRTIFGGRKKSNTIVSSS